jgi:catechol 2,3-dioxygenase-like lactoylglutathione lyase family enzyme
VRALLTAVGHHLSMGIVGIDHVQLAMPAGTEVTAVAFYSGVLGIGQVPKPKHLAKRGGCWFEDGPLKVRLGVEGDFRPARKAHPALLVHGLDLLVEQLRTAGIGVVDDEPLEGYDRVYVSDPFGNWIELLEPTSKQ